MRTPTAVCRDIGRATGELGAANARLGAPRSPIHCKNRSRERTTSAFFQALIMPAKLLLRAWFLGGTECLPSRYSCVGSPLAQIFGPRRCKSSILVQSGWLWWSGSAPSVGRARERVQLISVALVIRKAHSLNGRSCNLLAHGRIGVRSFLPSDPKKGGSCVRAHHPSRRSSARAPARRRRNGTGRTVPFLLKPREPCRGMACSQPLVLRLSRSTWTVPFSIWTA